MALTGMDANHGLAGEHLVWPTAITPAPQATLTKPPDMNGITGRIGPEPLIDMDDERERTRSLPDEPGSSRAPSLLSGSGRAPSTHPCHTRRDGTDPADKLQQLRQAKHGAPKYMSAKKFSFVLATSGMALMGLDANHDHASVHLVWPTAITPAPQATLTIPPYVTGVKDSIGPDTLIDMDDELRLCWCEVSFYACRWKIFSGPLWVGAR